MKKLIVFILSMILTLTAVVCVSACSKECKHENLTKTTGTPATCYMSGTEDYYQCKDCQKLFYDANATKEVPAGVNLPIETPMIDHDYGNGYLCLICGVAKPYETQIEGKTYIIDSASAFSNYDYSQLTLEVTNEIAKFQNSRYIGSAYTFSEQGTVSGVELTFNPDENDVTENIISGNYTLDGETLTISVDSRVENFEISSTFNGQWTHTREIPASQIIPANLNAPADLVITLEIRLTEINDHKLRHNENSWSDGVCQICGEENPEILRVEGTTWKITDVSAGYNPELSPNQAFEDFIAGAFEDFIDNTYTLNPDGSVTGGSAGGAQSWSQKGLLITVTEIQAGQFITFDNVFRLAPTYTEMQTIQTVILWNDGALSSANVPSEYYGGSAWAVITLTLQA